MAMPPAHRGLFPLAFSHGTCPAVKVISYSFGCSHGCRLWPCSWNYQLFVLQFLWLFLCLFSWLLRAYAYGWCPALRVTTYFYGHSYGSSWLIPLSLFPWEVPRRHSYQLFLWLFLWLSALALLSELPAICIAIPTTTQET